MHTGVRLSISLLLVSGCLCGSLFAEEFPSIKKDQARGSLEGYELLHVYPHTSSSRRRLPRQSSSTGNLDRICRCR